MILPDTTVLVAACTRGHPFYPACSRWLDAQPQEELILAAHALAELYNVLTGGRIQTTGGHGVQLAPSDALRIIDHYVAGAHRMATLNVQEYRAALRKAAEGNVTGSTIYDLLIAETARKGGAEEIATLNARHFSQVWSSEHIVDLTQGWPETSE